ncbi:MAG: hypothetical protein AAF483_10675 [Planctomycetota bacterium]
MSRLSNRHSGIQSSNHGKRFDTARLKGRNRGLILLVVLGMLALFSLLAVTYVVFASQSKSASMALARSETRGHKSHRSIMDSALMALLRGTSKQSPMYSHDMLADVFGAAESQGTMLPIRNFTFNNSDDNLVVNPNVPMAISSIERPMILNGHFLRIPLNPNLDFSRTTSPDLPYYNPLLLPRENDALNGRIVTFPEGNGPLSGESFHIVRYIGQALRVHPFYEFPTDNLLRQRLAQSYSIIIDLNEANLQRSYSASGQTGNLVDWLARRPGGNNTSSGAFACFASATGTGDAATFQFPYALLLNGTPLNAHGVGIHSDGSSQLHFQTQVQPSNNVVGVNNPMAAVDEAPWLPRNSNTISEMAVSLLPNLAEMGGTGVAGLTGRMTNAIATNQGGSDIQGQFSTNVPDSDNLLGDSDEPYDAADVHTMFMSHREAGATASNQIIPSFHRPSLINYIINWKKATGSGFAADEQGRPLSPTTWTEAEFYATMRRIEMATLRPLSYAIQTPASGGPIWRNPQFTGSNAGSAISTVTYSLNIGDWDDWPEQWVTSTGAPGPFQQWVNGLVLGPWDVDNDQDGVPDGIWLDPDLPLETSPDGKLLKVLVSYYVDDLDSKLDLNATGSLAQANVRRTNALYQPGTTEQFAHGLVDNSFYNSDAEEFFTQGGGYGPAEISMRHLFDNAPFTSAVSQGHDQELAFYNFMLSRYQPHLGSADVWPGRANADAFSEVMAMSERAPMYRHGQLPGLPLSPTGRASIGLDYLGNPRVFNVTSVVNETSNDPYEATFLRGGNHDSPFTIAEWERLYRVYDADRTLMPERLQRLFGLTDGALAGSNLRHELSPRTRHLRAPNLGARTGRRDLAFGDAQPFNPPFSDTRAYNDVNGNNMREPLEAKPTQLAELGRGPSSMMQLLNTIRHMKGEVAFDRVAMRNFFPMEFSKGRAMDLNRPFGNGIDDDGDGEIDEPSELVTSQVAAYSDSPNATPSFSTVQLYPFEGLAVPEPVAVDYATDRQARRSSLGADPHLNYTDSTTQIYQGLETRQLYARHLYCLAQLLIPDDYCFPNINKLYYQDLLEKRANGEADATVKYDSLRARILAQWAVNVVDFRDADSAMTRFVYDERPFLQDIPARTDAPRNQWEVSAASPVVWGMEAPEALLTESLAFHDIRLRKDPYNSTRDVYHQFRTPQGSLFLEIYCPRSTAIGDGSANNQNYQGASPALYESDPDVKLELSRMTPGGGGASYPIWRVYLTGPVDPADATPALKTPNERLMTPGTENWDEPQRHDLAMQLPSSNMFYDADAMARGDSQMLADQSGLRLDHFPIAEDERLADPAPEDARIILFTPREFYDPSVTEMPGIVNPLSQIFQNPYSPREDVNTLGSPKVSIRGGEYLVVGPRATTYIGSREDSKTGALAGEFRNSPNGHSITFNTSGTDYANDDATGQPWVSIPNSQFIATPQSNLLPKTNWLVVNQSLESVWADARIDELNDIGRPYPFNGLNISEPLIDNVNWYRQPESQVNTGDTATDGARAAPTFADGFANSHPDGYADWMSQTSPPSIEAPFDEGAGDTPFEFWNPVLDPATGATPIIQVGDDAEDVVSPGTQFDFSTAYLQRLADPTKPFHTTFNPYITVDWLSIDLTVFNGEDDQDQFDPDGADYPATYFASRQKLGQQLDSRTMDYDAQTGSSNGGHTFYSATTDKPLDVADIPRSVAEALAPNDEALWDFLLPNLEVADQQRPSASTSVGAFTTLGYLNSTYALSGDGTTTPASRAAGNDRYLGAPANPEAPADQWRPLAPYWPNRQFVTSLDLMMVPTSSPGQFMHEFSAWAREDNGTAYAPDFRHDGDETTLYFPTDRRTPVAPVAEVPPGGTMRVKGTPNDSGLAIGTTTPVTIEPPRYMPFSHLLNFFQEVSSLGTPDRHPLAGLTPSPSPLAPTPPMPPDPNPKNVSLVKLLELVETRSPWNDSERLEAPASVDARNWTGAVGGINDETAASNMLLAAYRAPYNRFPSNVEPGKVNFNSIAEIGVFQGVWSATIPPSDIDNPPYNWNVSTGTPSKGPEDVDHDNDGVFDVSTGVRREVTSTDAGDTSTGDIVSDAWNEVKKSRRGYDSPVGFYAPAYNPDPARLNPFFPTRFANPFRPSMEAGMVPKTWNPFPARPTATTVTAPMVRHNHLSHAASKNGVLDIYSRKNPAHATMLRGLPNDGLNDFDVDGDGTPDASGIQQFGGTPLYVDGFETLYHVYTNLEPMVRLKNLTSGTSNVFAVYMTVGFFEVDAAGNIGAEYGSSEGKEERYRGFFVVDRSIPVGYQIGQNHNTAKAIIMRRYLKARD